MISFLINPSGSKAEHESGKKNARFRDGRLSPDLVVIVATMAGNVQGALLGS